MQEPFYVNYQCSYIMVYVPLVQQRQSANTTKVVCTLLANIVYFDFVDLEDS